MDLWWLRARALLERQFAVVLGLLLVIGLVVAGLAYQGYVEPGTTTEERTVSTWGHSGWFNHSAESVGNNSLYPAGSTVEDQPVYLTRAFPVLDGEFAFRYNASDSGDLAVSITQTLVVHAVEERRQRTTETWRITRQLGNTTKTSLAPGQSLRVPFSINVNRTINRTEQIDEEFDNPPGQPEILVSTTINMTGTVNEQDVNRSRTYVLPIEPNRGAYKVNATVDQQRFERTESFVVERTPGPLQRWGSVLLVGIGLLGLGGVGILVVREEIGLSPAEREWLTYKDDREDFDEWITRIELPPEVHDLPTAEASSLGDLVDFAIDTNNSVVENPTEHSYYVVHDGYLYTYSPPSIADEQDERALDQDAGETDTDPDGESDPDDKPDDDSNT